MKIALVSGHFTPELGYQEVYLARSFVRLGHHVRVFTSTSISPTARRVVREPYQPGLTADADAGFEVLRLRSRISVSANVLAPGLRAAVMAFGPDIVLIIGLAKLYPGSLLCEEIAARAAIVTVFGDARDYVDASTPGLRLRFFLQRLLFQLVKRPLYRRAVRFSRRLVMNHAETARIILEQLRPEEQALFRERSVDLTLGYDPGEFYFRSEDRDAVRERLGVAPNEVLLVTCTRVNRRKNLESVVALVSRLATEGIRVRYLIAGFLQDSYEADFRAYVARQPEPALFLCLPFLGHDETRKIYCAADVGIWLKAAISIQEAMGTGLSVVLEDREIVCHLVEHGVNGWYFAPGRLGETLRAVLEELSRESPGQRAARRQNVLARNEARLSYDSLARRMIEGLAAAEHTPV
jgi:glycosyltransferase involved in cell wall biosynthesis